MRRGRIWVWIIPAFSLLGSVLDMKAERVIELQVEEVDPRTPLPGASVKLTEYPSAKQSDWLTDANGKCAIRLGESPASHFRVRVSREGYVPKIISWNTGNAGFQLPKELTLRLEKARTIGGVVTDPEGRPIAGATALLIIRGSDCGRSQEIHDDIWEKKAVTDDQGRWTFTGAPASLEYLNLRLSHPHFVGDDSGGGQIKPEEYFAQTARLQMNPGRVIEGTVRDQKGRELGGVAVLLNQHGASSNTQPEFTTDALGHYRITNAPQRTPGITSNGLLLSFFKKGFAPEIQIVTPGEKAMKLDVALPPANRLAGRVVDSAGKPIAGVSVHPDYWRNVRPFGCVHLTTDADGRFVWEDAPADEVIFDFLEEGYFPRRNVSLKAGTDVTLTMKRPIQLEATVVDAETGEPIPVFEIRSGIQWSDGRKFLSHETALPGKAGRFQWTIDEPAHLGGGNGKVVDEGGHFLRIQAPGYQLTDSRPVKDSEDSVQLEIKLNKGKSTAFQVLSQAGKPVAGAKVAVRSDGGPIQIRNGALANGGGSLIETTDASGQVTLPPMAGNPPVLVVDPQFGMARATLEEVARSGANLTEWGRVVVNSPAIKLGQESPFYLMDESPADRQPRRESPDYYLMNQADVREDGVLVFRGVKPGKAFVGRFHQPSNSATEVEVPAGGEVTLSLPTHAGIAHLRGKLALPKDLADLDWAQQRGNLQSRSDPRPWPAGLSLVERRKWFEDTPEGRKLSKEWRVYHPKIEADGSYVIEDIPPGKYQLHIPIYSGREGDADRSLIGTFEEKVSIPTREEIDPKIAGAGADLDGFFLQAQLDPPFFPCLRKGDQLPALSAEKLSGDLIKAGVRGKRAILVFYESIPEHFPQLSEDIQRAAEAAKSREVEVICLNTDDEKVMAEKWLKLNPLPGSVAWVGANDNPELLKKFGPVSAFTIYAVNADGTIRGRYAKATDALADFDK